MVELIDAVDLLLHNVEYRPLIQRHIDFASLRALSVELKKQYISEQTLNAQMNYANAIITTVKKELRVHSSATSIPDIDFYAISMNKYKIERFKEVAQLVKQERIIQQRLLYSYQIVVDAGPFNSVRELQKIKHSKAAMSESFALYDDPYSFLKNLRSRGDIASSEFYKYFAQIRYKVLNRYGSAASGGERSEFNLLQELNEVTSSEILILDEPESSFDNLFLKDGVDALLKDISRRIPVVIATHNNTIGLSVHPDYIIYTEKEILEDGTQKFHTYAGSSSSPELIDLDGNRISKQQILLDCLEAGKDAYMDRRSSYEIFSIEHGQVFFTFDESGNNKKGIDLITKEDLLKLIQCALEDEHFEMDSYDDSLVHNAAHKVIYKNIYQKLDDLLKHRIAFNDERTNLYRTAINAYTIESRKSV